MVTRIVLKQGSKAAPFYLKMDHGVVHALLIKTRTRTELGSSLA